MISIAGRFHGVCAGVVLGLGLATAEYPAVAASPLDPLPATFKGVLPCADCAGIRYQLTLSPGRRYTIHWTYVSGFGEWTEEDSGTWTLSGSTLTLNEAHGAHRLWAVKNSNTVRKLDVNGHAIGSSLPYELTRDAAAMKRSNSVLANNRWRVMLIGTRAVQVEAEQREPWILFSTENGMVLGSGGCNRISGSYDERGRKLRVGQLTTTLMACPSMEDEAAFLRALRDTRRYRLKGRILDLLDERGKRLVRLEESNL